MCAIILFLVYFFNPFILPAVIIFQSRGLRWRTAMQTSQTRIFHRISNKKKLMQLRRMQQDLLHPYRLAAWMPEISITSDKHINLSKSKIYFFIHREWSASRYQLHQFCCLIMGLLFTVRIRLCELRFCCLHLSWKLCWALRLRQHFWSEPRRPDGLTDVDAQRHSQETLCSQFSLPLVRPWGAKTSHFPPSP